MACIGFSKLGAVSAGFLNGVLSPPVPAGVSDIVSLKVIGIRHGDESINTLTIFIDGSRVDDDSLNFAGDEEDAFAEAVSTTGYLLGVASTDVPNE